MFARSPSTPVRLPHSKTAKHLDAERMIAVVFGGSGEDKNSSTSRASHPRQTAARPVERGHGPQRHQVFDGLVGRAVLTRTTPWAWVKRPDPRARRTPDGAAGHARAPRRAAVGRE